METGKNVFYHISASILIVCLALIIIPIPSILLDVLIIVNLIFVVLLLLGINYSQKTTEFSLLPMIFLLLTIYNLALNIETTRIILIKGPEFDIRLIQFISSFFANHSKILLFTSFILFIILFAFHLFVVIKGCTRISEVAARFTLDSMPIRMMAIEVGIKNGTMTEEKAELEKARIQKESDFYNSLDGASKFISGNEKVILFLFMVIIIGGTTIGHLYSGEMLSDAINTYLSLAIGSGIFFILPAFLLVLGIGIIISRAINRLTSVRETFVSEKLEQ